MGTEISIPNISSSTEAASSHDDVLKYKEPPNMYWAENEQTNGKQTRNEPCLIIKR
jgi:hypothetical protein